MANEVRNHIATTIKTLRNKADLTPEELGQLIGKSESAVRAWEQGRGQPDADKLKELADIFGVSVSSFFAETPALPAEEVKLLRAWREASPEGKVAALAVMQSLKKDEEM